MTLVSLFHGVVSYFRVAQKRVVLMVTWVRRLLQELLGLQTFLISLNSHF